MNNRQKEVLQASLNDEKAIFKALEKNYTVALADIRKNIRELQANPLTQSKAYQLEFQKQLESQVSGILDNLQGKNFTSIADYLNTCYNEGFLGSMYDMQGQGVPLVIPIDQKQVLNAVQKTGDDFKLSNKLGVSTKELKKQVQAELTRGLATELTYAEIARNISDYGLSNMNRSKTIARTEGHRVQNAARYDSMNAAKSKGADIVKQWDSTLDGNTRHTHAQLDGQIRELDANFEVGGKSAPCPGGFGDPAEDCNCRCAMLQRARWAVKDETSYNKWNNETGGIIECKGYDDFKEKYLKAADDLQKSKNRDIIEVKKDFIPAQTIDEAYEYFTEVLGLSSDNYKSMDVNVANMINKEVQIINEEFQGLKSSGYLKGVDVSTKFKSNAVASYSNLTNEVRLQKKNVAYKTSLERMKTQAEGQHKVGFWSTDSEEHTIRHEIGHGIGHWITDNDVTKRNQLNVMRESILKDCGITDWNMGDSREHKKAAGDIISYYALRNNSEFVAEAVAEYMTGKPRDAAKKIVEIIRK